MSTSPWPLENDDLCCALRLTGMTAPMVLDGPINGALQAYVDQVLVPELKPADVVIMDNLGSHKGTGIALLSRRPARSCDLLPENWTVQN